MDDPTVDIKLVAYLMTKDGIHVSDKTITLNPKYREYEKRAKQIAAHIGGEDYLSLDLALEDDDDATIDALIKQANENIRTRTTTQESADFSFISELNAKYTGKSKTLEENNMKKERPSTFTKGEKVVFEGRYATVTVPNGPSNTVGINTGKNIKMVDRTKITKLKEGILGATKVNGLFRMQQLAGLIKEDEVVPEVDYPDGDTYTEPSFDEPFDSSLEPQVPEVPALPAPDAVDPVPAPVDAMPMTPEEPMNTDGDYSLSAEYKEAVECLERVTSLIMDMKISEFKMFVDRAEDFSGKIKQIFNSFLEIK